TPKPRPRMTKKTEADPSHPPLKPATRLVTGGRNTAENHGFVNPPVYHASTVLYPSARDFSAPPPPYVYGRPGTPPPAALATAAPPRRQRSKTRCASSKGPAAPASRSCPRG